jgi:hypothetical protein
MHQNVRWSSLSYPNHYQVLVIQQTVQCKRHRPQTTLLYQLVKRCYPQFTANLAEQGKYSPQYVEREFDEFLRCG